MYYLMSLAMNHAFFQKFVEIFLKVGEPIIMKDDLDYENVFHILLDKVLGGSPDSVLCESSNNLLERFSNKNKTSTIIDQCDCDLYYPISNQFRAMLVCLQGFIVKIFEKGAGWNSDEGLTWFEPGSHETPGRTNQTRKKKKITKTSKRNSCHAGDHGFYQHD